MTPFEETVANQRLAADPLHSAWVGANAGAGKTRVLIDRVARLLLANTDPSKILCITYTKAAAAEMAKRLFDLLGDWALADDAKLLIALHDLEGENGPTRNKNDLAAARRLFARALETPGGLKIQTIHSFCEATLKRFPLEARVAPGFSVLDDKDIVQLAENAIDRVAIRAGDGEPVLANAFSRLSTRLNPDQFRSALASALGDRRQKVKLALNRYNGLDGLIGEIAKEIGADPDTSEEDVKLAALAQFSEADLRRAYDSLSVSGSQAQERAAKPIARFLEISSPRERWQALHKLFLTDENQPRKKIGDAKTDAADAWTRPYIKEQQELFVEVYDKVKAAAILDDTRAFLTILIETITEYQRTKAARACLDYDDLITCTRALFDDRGAEWVMYKLDQGLDHILLDEAQDTSPFQWDVIEAPLKEFFSGDSARQQGRTFFAVGDQKQSIYSFQGADASVFKEKEHTIGNLAASTSDYRNIPLTLSFRTTAPVLSFVDALFVDKEALIGLGDLNPLIHGVNRTGEAGLVALWPLTPRPEYPTLTPWDAPVDASPVETPVRTLSNKVAKTIKEWTENGELLESKGRSVKPGDIMILVQNRGPLFHETIKALARSGVPVAGADRLKLREDAAIEDLISFARFALLPTDDLSLAEILRSPFFKIDEQALYELAHGRDISLWRTLTARTSEGAPLSEAAAEIRKARAIGLREGAYAFFTHCLESGAPSGRKRLYSRLSEAVREPINEFLRQALDYEAKNPRSLQGFISWFENNAGDIKREMEQVENAVRVMTVHGAKGLEANIVFLIDAHRKPNTKKSGPVFELKSTTKSPDRPPHLLTVAARSADDCEATAVAREEAKRLQYEEHRRLLYVAATRARDRLYICGVESGNEKSDPHDKPVAEQTWHALAQSAFKRLNDNAIIAGVLWGSDVYHLSSPQTIPVTDGSTTSPAARETELPNWVFRNAPDESAPLRLSPSRLADEDEAKSEDSAYSPVRGEDRYFRGRILHRLLELLPDLPMQDRKDAAERLLTRLAPQIVKEERDSWRNEVLQILNDDLFAPVFATGSRAEVSVAGVLKGTKPNVVISGQIDRLAFDGNRILIVDYKTNRPPPKTEAETAAAYTAQMAAYRALLQEIYPSYQIEAALLWTHDARLMHLSSQVLDHAFECYISAG